MPPSKLLFLIGVVITACGWACYVGWKESPVATAVNDARYTDATEQVLSSDSAPIVAPSPPKKKSIQERMREMQAEMAEFEREGAKKLARLEAVLPMPLTVLAKDVASAKKPEYTALFTQWQLSPDQMAEVWAVIERREQSAMVLLHESIIAGSSTAKGMETVQKLRSAQSNAATEIENILGIERAQELAVWEKERYGTIKKRVRD